MALGYVEVNRTAYVRISGETVFVLEDIKYVTKQKYMEGAAGESGYMQNVKVPVDVQTFRCRRYVPAAGNSQSRYETVDFIAPELERND